MSKYHAKCACAVFLLASHSAHANGEPSREFNPLFELAYFEPTASNLSGSLGIKYEMDYKIKLIDPLAQSQDKPAPIPPRSSFWNLNLYSKGNLPFKDNFPVADFIETGFDIGMESRKLNNLVACNDDFCSNKTQQDSFVSKVSATYQFETDRDLKNKQHAYGVKVWLVYKTSDDSIIQYFNPLEWLPSLVKAAARSSGNVNGKTISAPKPFNEPYMPSLNLAIEQIDPKKDDARKAIDPSLKKFQRARIDVSYSSTLFKIDDKDVYRASFTFRHFKEISPEKPIQDAGIDRYTYRTFAIHTPNDVVISYSSGRLPFDAQSESMFKIGWSRGL